MAYAKVLYTCNDCGHYPVEVVEPAGAKFPPKCPECGSGNCQYEDVSSCDARGNNLE